MFLPCDPSHHVERTFHSSFQSSVFTRTTSIILCRHSSCSAMDESNYHLPFLFFGPTVSVHCRSTCHLDKFHAGCR